MNVNKKLKELGFSKIQFHKPNPNNDGTAMVLDNTATSWGIDAKTGRSIRVECKKIHGKSDSFWKLIFNEQYIIWIGVVSNNISKVWLQDNFSTKKKDYSYDLRKELSLLYDSKDYNSFILTNRKQIINLFPQMIKRDFILKDLFK
jgi:hypothetical protein